jgi:hypothetical protein
VFLGLRGHVFGNQVAQNFGADVVAKPLLNERDRSLAGPESRQTGVPPKLADNFIGALFDNFQWDFYVQNSTATFGHSLDPLCADSIFHLPAPAGDFSPGSRVFDPSAQQST